MLILYFHEYRIELRIFSVNVLLLSPPLGLGDHPALVLAEALHQAPDRALHNAKTKTICNETIGII